MSSSGGNAEPGAAPAVRRLRQAGSAAAHQAVEAAPLEPLPRWFWLLPAITLLLWWPLGAFWASDDFVAVHYARSLPRALSDFTGPQYGATDIWFFYRPLITLSLWLDTALGGGAPFVAHLSNALAHAVAALLVGLLWRRALDDGTAFCAGLLWAVAAGHIGAVCWAVGRVDGHTTVWILLSVWLFVRWTERLQSSRAPSLLAMALALLSKELALCLPGLIALCAFAKAEGRLAHRLVRTVAWTWPYVVLLVVYLTWRILVLGGLGGYVAASWQPLAMARGLGSFVLDLVNPLRWAVPELLVDHLGEQVVREVLPWAGYAPAAIAAVWFLLRPRRLLRGLLLVLLFGCAVVPVAPFLAGADNHHNLRYFYLGFTVLAGLLVAPGVWAGALAVLLFLPAFAQVRYEQWRADRQGAAMHAKLLQHLDAGTEGPWFVAGLPRANASGTALQFYFGVDRMLEPPFGPGGVRLYAHRPVAATTAPLRLQDVDGVPVTPPVGTTWLFEGAELLTTVPRQVMPELPLELVVVDAGEAPRADGTLDMTGDALLRMASGALQISLRAAGVAAESFRVTTFTATGYLSAVVPAVATGDGIALDWKTFWETARWSTRGPRSDYVLLGLEVPATLDLVPEFPVLVEAGRGGGQAFTPTHRARRMLTLRCDRDLPEVLRQLLPDHR